MKNPTYLDHAQTVVRLEIDDDHVVIVEQRTDPKLFSEAVAGLYGAVAPYVPDVDDGPVIPDVVVSRLQAKAALLQMGLLDQAETLISGMDPLTKLAWAEATSFKRTSPLLNALAQYVTWPDGSNLTANDLDQLFTIARTIEV